MALNDAWYLREKIQNEPTNAVVLFLKEFLFVLFLTMHICHIHFLKILYSKNIWDRKLELNNDLPCRYFIFTDFYLYITCCNFKDRLVELRGFRLSASKSRARRSDAATSEKNMQICFVSDAKDLIQYGGI